FKHFAPYLQWNEVTGDDENQNERRMHYVCQITQANQNNWLRTEYIKVDGARRIYIEVRFTIRSCEDVPNVATCKETFNLYYYETDRDEATTTFPPWREGAYIKVDTIAADQRFGPGSDKEVNFEKRNIGPISKNGIYLAFRDDTGACVAIMHVKVYYKYCGETLMNLASFSRTVSGPQITSLVEARGSCVRNAGDGRYPSLHCDGEGNWTVPTGTCVCTAGYEPNFSRTQCKASIVIYCVKQYEVPISIQVRKLRKMCCNLVDTINTIVTSKHEILLHSWLLCSLQILITNRGLLIHSICHINHYKSKVKNLPCQRCPAYSSASNQGATVCDCMNGYFRAPSDTADQPCTKPPTKVVNLYSVVNQTSVNLNWERPLNEGGRDDLTYSVQCYRCQSGFVACVACSEPADYQPRMSGLTTTQVFVHNLRSYAFYRFKITATNAVTNVAVASGEQPHNYAIVNVETNQAAPSAVLNVRSSEAGSTYVMLRWDAPSSINGNILDYEVTHLANGKLPASVSRTNRTTNQYLNVGGLEPTKEYSIKVRARTMAGFGPYSQPIKIRTLDGTTSTPTHQTNSHTSDPDILHLTIAIGAGVILVIATVVIAVIIMRYIAYLHLLLILEFILSNFGRKSMILNIVLAASLTKLTSAVIILSGFLVVCCNYIMSNSKKLKCEKSLFNGTAVTFNSSFQSNHKTYIDPTTYEDPQRAVSEFTKEIDASFIKIEQVIGAGEFGEVCRGRLQMTNKNETDVAIKTLKSGYSTQQKLDFLGEASIMGQFDHPNVIRLEGVVTKSRPLMIITEFMENGSLDVFLRNHDNGFTVIQLVGILRNIAAGMKYLSDMGYVHRDLAARNILVNAQLICKVSDFGMSRVLEEDSDAAYTARGGKIPIRWTAPEAFTYRKFTSASDVWSYGIVMWEVMSYGERPYWGMSNRDVMNAVETGYRLPAPMDCPQVQHRLMLECWKKDRNQRPKFGQIVSSLDKMLRDPSQLKAKANDDDATSGTNVEDASISPVEEWLARNGFLKFRDNFQRSGCICMEQIQKLTHSDIDRMGITSSEDQDRLIAALQEDVPDIPNYG
uniref:receptor protein-tyrosine kinase n=1 Tax=Ciona savignyi TaxID=51511 RepID=H2ZQT5_CIOSA